MALAEESQQYVESSPTSDIRKLAEAAYEPSHVVRVGCNREPSRGTLARLSTEVEKGIITQTRGKQVSQTSNCSKGR